MGPIYLVEPVADTQGPGVGDQFLDKIIIGVLVHEKSLGRGTHLTAIEIGGKGSPCRDRAG